MKYIVFSDGKSGAESPLIFPTAWAHSQIAERMASPGLSVVAAGFVKLAANGHVECSGRSDSLGIPSRPKRDAGLISKSLAELLS